MNVIGIVGWKNSGKTTLASAVIHELSSRGLTVNAIKHAHHLVDIDQPGTDSYKHREAGAQEVILAGGQRFAIMHELRGAREPTLDELLARLGPCDWVVVEGFKTNAHPKIEVHRQDSSHAPLYPQDPSIVAVAADYAADFPGPVFDINDVTGITDFILKREQP
ncbi:MULTISPECIES: molybdopterin-guanine dinucleotide biosynthesis protein B [Marinobacter]|uniref:Molybdopterin-guanine dinucleotide biosynthesis protein MobB n=1 Tax=Marinobacter excellens LAMA 842 TaxID=1306954 RepID=A0A137S588_9GAMM|nr:MULTISPECIES: molybdopterin-guanine dinucleotide biosynthesis protein B [Marinobacter]PKM04413.1 MAG: molybdopterin-guanine dinucleotide biosynthesis protein B [Gammaproteobacteria bacterium HGW-Gammaproteobacteria-6]WBU41671.1 molybdopterin-guanine dinucleotide biosynthesis protein B [Marinobacter alkaliphilus]KXO07600.1 Molybdopterin-guanine dinucleotide biosynthesis protein MobB [Marinobacter excellens LAMA 842]MAO12214.1 molybdopterin-guanine dinucleotide biosynthesis protein B [Marinoba